MEPAADYTEHENRRSEHSKKVLDSDAHKRIVMAGPGTRKSFLFQEVAIKLIGEGNTKIVVLTFINELVRDLAVDMHGLADVSTLHSFAAKQLRNQQTIYMDLLHVVEKDLSLENNQSKDLAVILHNLEREESEALSYLDSRRKYYASADPASIVFQLVNYYLEDESRIPEFDLVLVDEYQDFNLLEVALIDLLAKKSKILIAGDDDQSLYSFKHSRPADIRAKHRANEYTSFELPYCSRSTEVVIKAFHDFLSKAQQEGHLPERVDKQYLYFPSAKKDAVSAAHPKVAVKTSVFHTKNAYLIDQEITKIFKHEAVFDVLIICPLKKQIVPLGRALRKKGYNNISGDEFTSDKQQRLAEGLRFLVGNKDSNLAWRLCAEVLMGEEQFKQAVLSSKDCDAKFMDCVPSDIKSKIKKLRAICVKLEAGTALSDEERQLIFEIFEVLPDQLGEQNVHDRVFKTSSGGIHNTTKIKITTILGSKGLSYDYVFMVNFDDRYLIPDSGINDECINMFLVALTRSRKKIHVFTSKDTEPTFVSWIEPSRKLLS